MLFSVDVSGSEVGTALPTALPRFPVGAFYKPSGAARGIDAMRLISRRFLKTAQIMLAVRKSVPPCSLQRTGAASKGDQSMFVTPRRFRTGPHSAVSPTWTIRQRLRCCLALIAAAAASHGALAVPITLNTAALAGVSGRLEFDLLDNDFLAGNSVTISNIVSNGVFVGTDCSIGCTAGLSSFVLDDSLGFGQLLYDLKLGTSVSFDLSFTLNHSSDPGIDPDQFRVSLLDPDTNFTLVRTDLLPPSDAVLAVDLFGNGSVQAPTVVTPVATPNLVPEPGSLALVAIALLVLARRRVVAAMRDLVARSLKHRRSP